MINNKLRFLIESIIKEVIDLNNISFDQAAEIIDNLTNNFALKDAVEFATDEGIEKLNFLLRKADMVGSIKDFLNKRSNNPNHLNNFNKLTTLVNADSATASLSSYKFSTLLIHSLMEIISLLKRILKIKIQSVKSVSDFNNAKLYLNKSQRLNYFFDKYFNGKRFIIPNNIQEDIENGNWSIELENFLKNLINELDETINFIKSNRDLINKEIFDDLFPKLSFQDLKFK